MLPEEEEGKEGKISSLRERHQGMFMIPRKKKRNPSVERWGRREGGGGLVVVDDLEP